MSMCVDGTRVTDERRGFGLWVKHEEDCCPGGPNFSKTRGVWAHAASRSERIIGVLDTSHSQGGWAVARACQLLGKQCVEFYPVRKAQPEWKGVVQQHCEGHGAKVIPLQAGRSAVLYHAAKKQLAEMRLGSRGPDPAYMFPNALKLPEMITETAAEVTRTQHLMPNGWNAIKTVLVSGSSGTIAAGVCRGLLDLGWSGEVIVHQGYSRPQEAMRKYMAAMCGISYTPGTGTSGIKLTLVDEGYAYADEARPGVTPPWPCNAYYDLKALRWWLSRGREQYGEALMWNIG